MRLDCSINLAWISYLMYSIVVLVEDHQACENGFVQLGLVRLLP